MRPESSRPSTDGFDEPPRDLVLHGFRHRQDEFVDCDTLQHFAPSERDNKSRIPGLQEGADGREWVTQYDDFTPYGDLTWCGGNAR